MEERSDVLTFTTAPLDGEFAITGHMYATLYVSSNATDTDFTAKVGQLENPPFN
jgi:predicted acyl esterase